MITKALPLQPVNTMPAQSLRRKVLELAQGGLYWSGGAALYTRWQNELPAAILMYHSVPSAEFTPWIDPRNSLSVKLFAAQMRFLSHHRRVISMTDLADQLQRHIKPYPGQVVVTFDDGYLDNLQVAAPILAQYQLPAIIYLATDSIDKVENQWVDQLYTFFRARSKAKLAIAGHWDLADPVAQHTIYRKLMQQLCKAPAWQREEMLADVKEQLQPLQVPPRLTLSWDDVRRLVAQYPNIEIGVHTASHLDLAAHSGEATKELSNSIARVESEIGSRPKHFSFPYGCWNQLAQKKVIEAGLHSAVATADDPVVRTGADKFALPRLPCPRSMTQLRFWTSGAYPDLSKWVLKRI